MMVLKPGSLFAERYEIVGVVSAGGMGIVYEVLHRETKRRRALKVMLPHVVTDPEMRARFALEAVVTADIESEHLVEVFDAGIDAETDCPYLVMELLRGEDLGSRLRRGERCSPPELVGLLEQAALALEKTHAAGIVHRDLKPENLFLTKRDDGSPRLKILDFGIAKVVRVTAPDPKSTTKTFGTPYYMAREQVTGEAQLIGPSSDTYALAQITYALLVGRPYFDDDLGGDERNILALLLAVGKGPSEAASVRAERRGIELPTGFDKWFARATSTQPRARFDSAKALVSELAAILRDLPPVPLAEKAAAAGDPPVKAAPVALGGTVPMPISGSVPPPPDLRASPAAATLASVV
ncbi:MAG: serine/threonine protein kinase, partial [Polyangiaceae bacterium]|nr:serine/threonine protein kinase [Polyangiaceae bacterium]